MSLKINYASKTRVFLVDDHPMVRRGLQLLIGLEPDMVVCGEAEDAPQALQQIIALQPEIAVVDLSLKVGNSMDLIRDLRTHCPRTRILVFTMHNERFYEQRVMEAGANGYVTKDEGPEKAVKAIRLVMQGKTYFKKFLAPKKSGLSRLAQLL